jgi:hypothetical protein
MNCESAGYGVYRRQHYAARPVGGNAASRRHALTGSATARVASDDVKESQYGRAGRGNVYRTRPTALSRSLPGAAKEVRGTITTLQGVQLNVKGKQLGAGQLRFVISVSPSGIYLLRMEVDGRIKTYKLLKE